MSQIDDPKVTVGDDDPADGPGSPGSGNDRVARAARRAARNGASTGGGRSTAAKEQTDPEAEAPAEVDVETVTTVDVAEAASSTDAGTGPDTGRGATPSTPTSGGSRTVAPPVDAPDADVDELGDAEPDWGSDLDPDGERTGVVDVELDEDLAAFADDEGFDEFWGETAEEDDSGAPGAVPPRKKSRHQKRKEWRQSERARRYAARRSVRFPIFTRSVLLWMLLFAMMGAAFGGSGAFFWAHFNTEIAELREQTTDFDKRSQEARAEIDAMRNQAITDINNQLKPIAPFLAEANTIKQAQTLSPYVWFVATLDEEGKPSVGSAFSVVTDDSTTLMITSYTTVKAATVNPAPFIGVRKGAEEIPGTLVSFDVDRDLALIEVQRANMPVLEWASDDQQATALGLRVFPVSGFGATGASLTSGIVIDQSAAGTLHTAPVGSDMQGGPIVTADYKVIGVASLTYHPLGFDPGETHFSVQINSTCAVLLECGGGARTKKP